MIEWINKILERFGWRVTTKDPPKHKPKPKLTTITGLSKGDRCETTKRYVEEFSRSECRDKTTQELLLPGITKQQAHKTGTVVKLSPLKDTDSFLVYYHCDQTDELDWCNESWVKAYTGIKYRGDNVISDVSVEDVLGQS